jgi:pimeloyl-ACP methyl ester carboxylesterase
MKMLPQVIVLLAAIILPDRLLGYPPVSVQEAVEIGGIKQWVSIKGTDDHHPVLLFLHGGPGNSVMGYADKFTSELQKHFIVVIWDQRESGRTAELNHSPAALTVSQMEGDAIEMINYLRHRFLQDKIYLMGHSWGGFLGLRVASSHPQLLTAYFAVSPMVNQLESERISLEWMRKNAAKQGNQVALHELSMIRIPFQNGEQLYYHRKWLAKGMGTKSPEKGFVEAWAKTWLTLFNEASAVNFFLAAPELKCPVYFFVGGNDYQTYARLTEQYFNMVKAEKKDLFWFTNSAHNLNLTEPKKLQDLVISLSLSR